MTRLELEQVAVGGALVSARLAEYVVRMGAATFRDPSCRAVAVSIARLHRVGQAADSITVGDDLISRGRTAEAQKVIYLAATVPSLSECADAATRLLEDDGHSA